MTEVQATTIIETLERMEFLVHVSAITLTLMFGVMCFKIVRHAMDRRSM